VWLSACVYAGFYWGVCGGYARGLGYNFGTSQWDGSEYGEFQINKYASKYASGVLSERVKARSLDVAVQQCLDVLNASPRQGMSLCLSVKTADYPEPAQLELLGGSFVAECIGKVMLEMQLPLSLFDDVQLEFGGVALPLDSTLEHNDIETDARLSLTMNGNDQIQALFSLSTTVAQTGNSSIAPQPHGVQGNVTSMLNPFAKELVPVLETVILAGTPAAPSVANGTDAACPNMQAAALPERVRVLEQDGSYKEKTKSLAEEKDLEEPPAKKSKVNNAA